MLCVCAYVLGCICVVILASRCLMLFVLFTTERMECENVDRFCSETFVETEDHTAD